MTDLSLTTVAVVFQVRDSRLNVLLWKRALPPHSGRWSLPSGGLLDKATVEESIRTHLAVKVDLQQVCHLEQLGVWSGLKRRPATEASSREVAVAFLGLVPIDVDPELPGDTAWHPVDDLPKMAFDHEQIVLAGRERLRSKLSYTNIGFALAPSEFSISELQAIYEASLGHRVAPTNLQRVLTRREAIVEAGTVKVPVGGGRPARVYRFVDKSLKVTDQFAVFRPQA